MHTLLKFIDLNNSLNFIIDYNQKTEIIKFSEDFF